MSKSNKFKIIKIVIFIITILLMAGITIYLYPVMKNLSTYEGQIEFKQKVSDSGVLGFLMLLGLQFAQIFLVVLPGEPLEVLAGMCYGAIGGTIFIFFSVALTTTVIFFLVRKFGKELIYDSFDKNRIDKIENSRIFQDPKKIEYIFAICFAIIGTPKDLLTYLGALFPIKPLRFIMIATFCRFPSIISSTIVGQYFSKGNWKISIIIYLLTFIFTFLVLFLIRKFDKDKTAENALKELK